MFQFDLKSLGITLSGLCAVSLAALPDTIVTRDDGYVSYYTGSPGDVDTPTSAGLMLEGGAALDVGIQWVIQKSGGGNFVVLRARGEDEWNSWVYGLGKLHSVETLVITSRAGAMNPYVVKQVRNAEALFIGGGDQSHYVNYWKATPLQDAINGLAAKGVPIGGTSAGLAVLGDMVYSAQNESAVSDKTLNDPYNSDVMFDHDFLKMPFMENLITDTHFVVRDRMGRLLGFMGRLLQDGFTKSGNLKGVAVDEGAAVAVEGDGSATILGDKAAYFLHANNAPQTCVSGVPLTFESISVYKIQGPSATFDFGSWTGTGGVAYTLGVENGTITSTQDDNAIY